MSESGIHLPGHVDDVAILEAANHLKNRVDLANVAEELVAQPFTFASSLDDPGNVDEPQRGRHQLLGDDVPADPRADCQGY